MEKVKVTKEVAEAINEIIKRNDGNKAYAIVGFTKRPFSDKKLTPLNAITDDEGVQAIYFGYEVEKTPEQNLAEIYRYYRYEAYTTDMSTYADGIVRALDTLGIKIEGVNAQ